MPRPAPSELAEHSTSVEHSLRPLQPEPSKYPTGTPRGVVGASDNQPVSEPTEQSRIAEQPRSRERLSPGTYTVPLLPELSGETWVASALIEEFTADLLPAGSNVDLITASRQDETLATVRGWIQNPLRHGRIVLDSLRNGAVGGYK